MGRLGADATALESLARQMAAAAADIAESRRRVDTVLRRGDWDGRDADAFFDQWMKHRGDLTAAAAGLRDRSDALSKNAEEQINTSNSLGDTSGTAAAGSGFTHGRAPSELTRTDILNGGHLPSASSVVSGEAKVGYTPAAVDGAVSAGIEDFPGPHSVITVGTAGGVQLTAGAGGGVVVDLGDDQVGQRTAAGLSAGIEVGSSQSWVVKDSEARELLNDYAIDHLAKATLDQANAMLPLGFLPDWARGAAGPLGWLGLGADKVSTEVMERVFDPVPPDISSTHMGLVASGSALAALGLGSVGATGNTSTIVSRHTARSGSRSYSIDSRGEASGALTSALFGIDLLDPAGELRTVVSIGESRGGLRPVELKQIFGTDGDLTAKSQSITLDDSRLSSGLDEIVTELADGDVSGARQELASAVVDVGPPQQHTAEVTERDWGLTGSAGAGSVSGTLTERTTEWAD